MEIDELHYYYGTISEVLEETENVKGEIVIVVEGNQTLNNYQELSLKEHVDLYLQDNITLNEAMKKVAKERGIAKSIVYKEYHKQ